MVKESNLENQSLQMHFKGIKKPRNEKRDESRGESLQRSFCRSNPKFLNGGPLSARLSSDWCRRWTLRPWPEWNGFLGAPNSIHQLWKPIHPVFVEKIFRSFLQVALIYCTYFKRSSWRRRCKARKWTKAITAVSLFQWLCGEWVCQTNSK